jgi:hypothetical protein
VPDLPAARDAEKPEEAVYGTMRARAFDLFQRRLFASLFTGGK